MGGQSLMKSLVTRILLVRNLINAAYRQYGKGFGAMKIYDALMQVHNDLENEIFDHRTFSVAIRRASTPDVITKMCAEFSPGVHISMLMLNDNYVPNYFGCDLQHALAITEVALGIFPGELRSVEFHGHTS